MTVTACLIIIGNEILSGRTQDKNLSHIAKNLNEVGVRMTHARVIPDVEETIVATVNEVRPAFDYVFTTGGIGPTHDDITSAAIAKAFGVKLVRDKKAEQLLTDLYKGTDKLNEARLKMADVPEGAELIANPVSAAPGFRIGNVYVMAGVPNIMQSMLAAILPTLKGEEKLLSENLTTDIPEGTLAKGLGDIQARYPDVEIGSYPHFAEGKFSTTLVFHSPDKTRNQAAFKETEALLAGLGGRILPTA